MKLISINPFSEEVNAELAAFSDDQVEEIVKDSRAAYRIWRRSAIEERSKIIKKVGEELRKNKERLAELITREMGKVIRESKAEIDKCAWLCDYFADRLTEFLAPEPVITEAKKSYVDFEPLGIILGIMPWNFPFWQVFRFAIPALAAGNTVLLKHASNVPLSALEIEKIFVSSGLPSGAFRTLLIGETAAMNLIESDKVDGVSLTGSNRAGEIIGGLAGKKIINSVLELGGSDPFIVLDDAELERTAQVAVQSRFINAGQSCIAAKRFFVTEKNADAFIELFKMKLTALKVGDPLNEKTDIGPLAQKRFVDGLTAQLEDSLKFGGQVILGPEPEVKRGFFFRPLAVYRATDEMRIMKEEVFGPVAPVMVVKSEGDAIRLANATVYGLGASIWSADLERAEKIAKDIEAGFVVINDMVKSDPRLPFGGIKKSGVGRELSRYGILEFANIKTVVINEAKRADEKINPPVE